MENPTPEEVLEELRKLVLHLSEKAEFLGTQQEQLHQGLKVSMDKIGVVNNLLSQTPDNLAVTAIARLMSGTEWDPDTLNGIADIVRSTGRIIRDCTDVVDGSEHVHNWIEDKHHPTTGCGAEWFYDCECGATKYVCTDQGETTTAIKEADRE